MKHILTVISCLLALNLTAQEVVVEYPYNPDFENDGNVGVEDLLQLLSAFDMAFEVGELTIDEVVLSEWLQTISQTLIAQQAMIDSLQISSLEPSLLNQILDALTAQGSIIDSLTSAGPATLSNMSKATSIAWPYGAEGRVIVRHTQSSPFIVPEDSVLMVTFANTDLVYEKGDILYPLSESSYSAARPLPFGEGVAVSISGSGSWYTGVLVPSKSEVEVVFWHFFTDGAFVIPEEKVFISRWGDNGYGGNQILGIFDDGISIASSNAMDDIMLPGGTELYDGSGYGGLLGYLVDEDYFGSSSSSSSSEAENIGLAFGERQQIDFAYFDWQPTSGSNWQHHAIFHPNGDGMLEFFIEGCPNTEVVIVPDTLNPNDFTDALLTANAILKYEGSDFFTSVKADEMVVITSDENATECESILSWLPLVSSPFINDDSSSEQSLGPCQGELTVQYHGYDYELVEIADQCWFAENLQTENFRNGDAIDLGLPAVLNPTSAYMPAGNPICGCVYNKAIIYDGRLACPQDFHVPTALDFSELLGATIGWPLISGYPTGFNAFYGSATDPLYTDGNNCGAYNPFVNQWYNLEARFLTSTFASGSITADEFPDGDPNEYYDFHIYGDGPEDAGFGSYSNYLGQYIRCIKD
jgi:uncharacterized protein (TIGR02145 family)